MNRNTLVALLVVTVVVVAAAAWLAGGRDDAADLSADGLLLPELAGRVNDLEAVDIHAAGDTAVRLRRERERWRVAEYDGYEADFERVHDLLRALATAERGEARTADPADHALLGLADPGADAGEGTGVRIAFPGTDIDGLVLGRTGPTGRGRFVRRAGSDQVWLVGKELEVSAEALDWLERSVMDIPRSEIARVTVTHPDGREIRLQSPADSDGTFALMNAPEAREAGPAWRRNALAGGLAGLRLEDVRSHDGDRPDDAVRVRYTTHDGLVLDAAVFRDDAGPWIHFTAARDAHAADGAEAADEAVDLDAVAVDGRLSPWQFRITDSRYGDLTGRLEEYLAPLPEESDQAP